MTALLPIAGLALVLIPIGVLIYVLTHIEPPACPECTQPIGSNDDCESCVNDRCYP